MGRLLALIAPLLLTSCSYSASVRPTAPEVIGTYWYGDGIGFGEELILKPDGTFESTLMGHLGSDALTFGGTWRLNSDRIDFKDSISTPVHTYALTQTYKGVLVLIPEQYAKAQSVHESHVYMKRPSK